MTRPYRLLIAGAALCAAAVAFARQGAAPAASRIQHIVVIYQENESFDHYFGTYPVAANPAGEPRFIAAPGTPRVDGFTPALLTDNPNLTNPGNGNDAGNPFRLDRAQAATADQDHSYHSEQMAFDNGRMDLFPRYTGRLGPPPRENFAGNTKGLTMGYFDGNTVTALWNYAQHFAMSDHSFGTTFGPSTVGAINLVSGQTNGVVGAQNGGAALFTEGGADSRTLIGDADPLNDACTASSRSAFSMSGRNIGDLLSAANLTWGWFQGGFDLDTVNANGTTGCLQSSYSPVTGLTERDYVAHHEPFQYYASTSNPEHKRPANVAAVGKAGDAANHQYDLQDFFAAIGAGNFPAVSFLKPPAYQNGHAGNSDPLDEQNFLVRVLNFIQQRPEWSSTVVIIAWDDSDGWYDHLMGPIANTSAGPADGLTAANACGDAAKALPGVAAANAHAHGRCGYGPRLPLLVLSPWSKPNYVDHTVTDQTSVLRFIEDTFLHGQRIGQGSFDALAGSLDGMFDFSGPAPRNAEPLLLQEGTGMPIRKPWRSLPNPSNDPRR